MKSDRWKEIERIYHAALERTEDERAAFLDETCLDDAGLRREVESLLGYETKAEGFIENPALDVAAENMGRGQAQPMIGRRVGVYEISALIGKGGMGEVYQARDTRLGRNVAIKTLPDLFSEDPDRLARFEREARILASLNHPNIATIHGLEESDGDRFLVQELIDGATLADRLRDGPIPVEEALRLAVQIAEALEAAHERGIVHRDLKPANIKITSEERVKVLDFGLAKATHTEQHAGLSTLTAEEHAVMGTLAYMSPEQARGKEVDRRTDVWAFGCVLFEMLAGRMAFEGGTVSDTIAQVLEHDPNWEALPEGTPAKIRDLLERCLVKDFRNRQRDVGDIRVEIDRVLSAGGGVVGPVADAIQAPPRSILSWALTTLLLVAVATVAAWNLKPSDPRSVSRFVYELPEDQILSSVRGSVVLSPDGSRVLYAASGGLYLRSIDALGATLIPGTEGSPNSPFFSPDGEWVGYRAGGQLTKIALTGGPPVSLCDASPLYGASWGTDDTILFGQSGGIMRVSANGGIPETLVPTERGERFFGPQILPDGKSLLYTVAVWMNPRATLWDEAQVVVRSLETGEEESLFEGHDARYLSTGHLVYISADDVYAIPFDLTRLESSGESVPVVRGVARTPPALTTDSTGDGHFDLSDRGSLVYVPAGVLEVRPDLQQGLVWVDRDGSNVTPLDLDPGGYEYPSISPDGMTVAFGMLNREILGHIWLYDLAGSSLSQFTFEGTANRRPVWTPDGSRITFYSDREPPRDIYWKLTDLSGQAELLLEQSFDVIPGSWSVDNILTFFSIRPDSGPDIGTLEIQDGIAKPIPFLETQAGEAAPRFSPNGKWIAYMSRESGALEVWVRPYPNTGGGQRRVSIGGGTEPVWSPDGRELFFRSPLPDSDMMAARVLTDPVLTFEPARKLFDGQGYEVGRSGGQGYAVHPDGRFLMITRDQSEEVPTPPQRIHVVLNFLEELKERVPVP